MLRTLMAGFLALTLTAVRPQDRPAAGRVLFFDDFDGPALDAAKWVPGLHHWGRNNRGVVPENLSLRLLDDNGRRITVLATEAHGDLYQGPVKGIETVGGPFKMGDAGRYRRVDDGTRVGGLVWTRERWGGGRYEIRMKNLPRPGGCSCIWNYYHGSPNHNPRGTQMHAESARIARCSR